MRQEERRHRQAATAAEAALAAAHAATLEAKSHYNPLQHPLVRAFRSASS